MSIPSDMKAVAAALRENERFVVTSHEAPDGDALGSLLALGLALRELGKDVGLYGLTVPRGGLLATLAKGAGDVVHLSSECVGFDEDADVVLLLEEHPDEARRREVTTAVRYCPAFALSIEED